MSPEAIQRKLAALLSADAVGYSRLMAEDEVATLRTLDAHRDVMRGLIRRHAGRVVDAVGDNLLAEFPSVTDGLECAVAIQRELRIRNADAPEHRRMPFRIGVHLGDVMVEGERIAGDGVNIAARLEALAEPGGICISGNVYDQVRSKVSEQCDDLGEHLLKNIAHPVRVYRLRLTASPEPSRAAALTVPGFAGRPAIAVLAFDNLSGDPEQEYFADGIAEDLITRLSAWRDFPVIARNSSFVYKGRSVAVKQLSEELGARYVVEGSVRVGGNRVRISAQLIDAVTGHHLWAERYDREVRDIFEVQDEISEAIVAAMSPELHRSEGERVSRMQPESLGAWDLVTKGWWLLDQDDRITQEANAKALRCFEQAVQLAPRLARAHSGMAYAHCIAILSQWTDSPNRSAAEAIDLARKAVSLDGRAPLSHLILGFACFTAGEPAEAIDSLERALELDPSSAQATGLLGLILAVLGRSDDAIATLERAMRLSPHDPDLPRWLDSIAWAHFAAERYEEAVRWARRSVQHARRPLAFRALAAGYAQLDRLSEARSALEEELRLEPDLTLSKVRQQNLGTNPEFLERWLDGLRKAGLKE